MSKIEQGRGIWKGSFMQCITGGPPVDSSNSMNEGGSMRKADFLSI